VDVADSSLRTAVAAFLAVLHDRPRDKDLARFYGFFDPFYYNGQLVMTYKVLAWSSTSAPQFGLATPCGEHVMWESNPALMNYVNANISHMVLGGKAEKGYVPLPEDPGLWSREAKERKDAYGRSMAEYVRRISLQSHGRTPVAVGDFRPDFQDSLDLSVKCVFSALRSCITAIRGKATYAYFPQERKYRVYCDVRNVAEESVQLKQVRVSLLREGKLLTRSNWTKPISYSVAKSGQRRVAVEFSASGITETEPQFYVDVFGRYQHTPDLGFWRGEVSQRPGRIQHGCRSPLSIG